MTTLHSFQSFRTAHRRLWYVALTSAVVVAVGSATAVAIPKDDMVKSVVSQNQIAPTISLSEGMSREVPAATASSFAPLASSIVETADRQKSQPAKDAHQKYVGTKQKMGAVAKGLALRVSGAHMLPDSDFPASDGFFQIVSDDKDTMLWVGRVLDKTTFKVVSVYDIPDVASTDRTCWGFCKKGDVYVSDVLAVFDCNGNPLLAWKVDQKKFTAAPIDPMGFSIPSPSSKEVPQYSELGRPELYYKVALCQSDDAECAWHRENQGVTVAGAWMPEGGGVFTTLRDSAEQKQVVVSSDGTTPFHFVAVQAQEKTELLPGNGTSFTYKGESTHTLVAQVKRFDENTAEVVRAWLLDATSKKFVEVAASNVKLVS